MTTGDTHRMLAKGFGLSEKIGFGVVLAWRDEFLGDATKLNGKVIYHGDGLPLYRAAYIAESGAAALIIGEGNRNYHPLILATEAGMPAIAGVGQLNIEGLVVTVIASEGAIYEGEYTPEREKLITPSRPVIQSSELPIYVNVGYPNTLTEAANSGADGVGLIRTEFSAVRALALNLKERSENAVSIQDMLVTRNEADVIYFMADDKALCPILREAFKDVILKSVSAFENKDIYIRTLDIARSHNDPMGNRGIRRDVASGGNTITLLGQAIYSAIEDIGDHTRIGVILPLVSHYSQIRFALKKLLDCGLSLRSEENTERTAISFGWEIEQPAASQNNWLWLKAFQEEFKQPPHLIGVGTNDLTQFTIALGRDAASSENTKSHHEYLEKLYDERDFSVIRQIIEVAMQCQKHGTQVFLLGQIGADPLVASLMFSIGAIPSVGTSKVSTLRDLSHRFLTGDQKDAVSRYITHVSNEYPECVRHVISDELNEFFIKNGATLR